MGVAAGSDDRSGGASRCAAADETEAGAAVGTNEVAAVGAGGAAGVRAAAEPRRRKTATIAAARINEATPRR